MKKTMRKKGFAIVIMMLMLCGIYFATTITAYAVEMESQEVDIGITIQEDAPLVRMCVPRGNLHTLKG